MHVPSGSHEGDSCIRIGFGRLYVVGDRPGEPGVIVHVKYISGIRRRRVEDGEIEDNEDGLDLTDLSVSLNPAEKAKETAWAALVSAHLGDLVVCP